MHNNCISSSTHKGINIIKNHKQPTNNVDTTKKTTSINGNTYYLFLVKWYKYSLNKESHILKKAISNEMALYILLESELIVADSNQLNL